jgi:hypothetical protein
MICKDFLLVARDCLAACVLRPWSSEHGGEEVRRKSRILFPSFRIFFVPFNFVSKTVEDVMLSFRFFGILLLVTFAAVSLARQVWAATLIGVVLDAQGNPVGEAEIAVHDATGKAVARAVTNAKGEYVFEGLPPGQYNLSLNPLHGGFQGQTVVASLGEKGLTVSWTVSPSVPAVAAATPGLATTGGILGLGNTGTFLGGVGLLGAGVGGAAAGGSFSGGNTSASPVQ